MTLMPFSLFQVNLRFELSHFEMDIEDQHIIVRYNYHQHANQGEMLGYKVDAKDQFDLKIATGCGELEFPPEEKNNKADPS